MSIDRASRLYASARQQLVGEKAPQSNFVRLKYNGRCDWWPMFEESVSQCPITVTWFPFDDQQCRFIFESWKYPSSQLAIRCMLLPENQYFEESEQWQLLGT